MITTTDTANILYKACQVFGIPVFQGGNVPKGLIDENGRIVIHIKEQTPENIWKKGFVEVNLFAADTPNGNADLIKLNELERTAVKELKSVTGVSDGTPYRFTISSVSMMSNEDLKAHYINVRLLFKVLNTME